MINAKAKKRYRQAFEKAFKTNNQLEQKLIIEDIIKILIHQQKQMEELKMTKQKIMNCVNCNKPMEKEQNINYTLTPSWSDIIDNIEEITKAEKWKLGQSIKYAIVIKEHLKQIKNKEELKEIIELSLPPNKQNAVFLLQTVLSDIYNEKIIKAKTTKYKKLTCTKCGFIGLTKEEK